MMQNKVYYWITTVVIFFMTTVTIQAQDYTVNSLADTNTGAGTSGTLRWCMNQANAAGAGPHAITFDAGISGGTITILSHLPVVSVSNVTIDGLGDGSGNITIDANGGDIARHMFRADGNGDFTTFRNFILQNTGWSPFNFSGSPTDITIENIVALHTGGNLLDYGVYYAGNALNLTILNFKMTQKQRVVGGSGPAVINITGTANNVLIDNFDLSDSGGTSIEAIRIAGAANNVTIQNCDIDLDLIANGDDGDYGIRFLNTATNITLKNNTFTNIDSYALHFASTTNNINIDGFEFVNGDGGTTTMGMRFVGVATGIIMDNVTLDLDHSGTTDDGDYGIYFNTTVNNVSLDHTIMHDPERIGFFIGGVATNVSILNSTFDNFDGWNSNNMIYFGSVVNGITMTNVTIDEDFTDGINDGDVGVYFNSHINQDNSKNAIFTNLNIKNADYFQIQTKAIVNNLTIEGSTFTGNTEANARGEGIDIGYNSAKTNILINNNTFLNLQQSGILLDTDGTNATSNIKITNNIISGTTANGTAGYAVGNGIIVWEHNGVTQLEISGNTIFDNAATGIAVTHSDGIDITKNNIYNNGLGIDNQNNTGNDDLEQADGDTPTLYSSINVGGGNYDVTFNVPAFCTDCDVEFFTNQAGDTKYNGRSYTDVATNLSAAGNPHTITVNGGGATDGFWTTTLKNNTLNGSVSEFSKSVAINPKGPANIDAGIALWVRADISGQADGNFTVGNGWLDFSGNENNYDQAVASDPELVSNVINFNQSVVFDGNDYLNQLNTALNAFPTGNDDRTVFIVSKITAASSETAFSYGRNATSQNQSWRYENGLMRYIGWGNDFTGAGAFSVNEAFIGRYDHDGTTASINSDGREVSTSPRTYNTLFSTGSSHIGVRIATGAEAFIGDISEVIVYNRNLTDVEKNRVESYLALKYGISLDQTAATDYFASDGTTKIWDATTIVNAVYSNNVTGIGRDDDGFFNQKQSKSINDDAVVTMGLGEIAVDNPTNANTFAADKNFLLWGNDNASTGLQTTEMPAGATATYRLGREWKVQETGSVSNLTVAFSDISSTAYDLELYVDTDGDGDFTNATIITGGTLANGVVTFTGVDLDNNDLFTLGYTLAAPGGVIPSGDTSSLRLWLRANDLIGTTDGSAIATWVDNSTHNNNATQATASLQSKYTEIGNNFNPTMTFDGSDRFNLSKTMMGTGNYPYSFFTEFRGNGMIYNVDVGSHSADPLNVGIGSASTHWHKNYNGAYTSALASSTYGKQLVASSRTGSTITQYNNGLGGTPVTLTAYAGGVNNRWIGYRSNGGAYFTGDISEMIMYDVDLTDIEKQRVNSYMAIKYGFPLDQSTPYNYLASDESVIWDATANALYTNDVAGIGKDDLSALTQKQSKSVNDDAIVSIGLGEIATTNIANANTFTADKDFLVWGNDDASTELQTTEMPAGVTAVYRLGREWKLQETGSVSNLTVAFSGISSGAYDIELYVDTDGNGDFTNATIITGGTLANGVVTFSGVDLNNGDLFTLGYTQPAPGGVVSGISGWYRGDSPDIILSGTNVSQWDDFSGNDNYLSGGSGGEYYNATSNLHNFNQTVNFTGSQYIYLGSNNQGKRLFEYSSNIAVFSVANQTSGAWLFSEGASNGQQIRGILSDGSNAYWDAPYGYRTNGTTLAPFGSTPYIGRFTKTPTNISIFTNAKQTASGNGTYANYPGVVNTFHLGARSGDAAWAGNVSEFIVYDDASAMTVTQRTQIESYLALKYGVTLDQTATQNYIASDGTTIIWDAGVNTTYSNDIAGIGRDDLSALIQKQSKSVNDDAIVSIGLGEIATTNIANANTFTTDKDFLVWGNDDASTGLQSTEMPAGVTAAYRLGREWKVQETGTVSNLTVAFSDIPSAAYNFELYVDTDGDFTNATIITGGTLANGVVTFTGVDLNNGDVFTLGLTKPSPGGVSSTLEVWLRADMGVLENVGTNAEDLDPVKAWVDQSGERTNNANDDNTSAPTFKNNVTENINFNPVIDFDGTNDGLDFGNDYVYSSGDGLTSFSVVEPDDAVNTKTRQFVYDFGRYADIGYGLFYGDDNVGHYTPSGSSGVLAETTHSFFTTSTLIRSQIDFGTDQTLNLNGALTATLTTASTLAALTATQLNEGITHTTNNGPFTIGRLSKSGSITLDGGRYLNGSIGEVVVYASDMIESDYFKVESYLGIKYGMTLKHNYVASDATVTWNATTNTAYSNDIAGIGRDDLSALNQKISKSVNPETILTMALDANFISSNNDAARMTTHTNDKQFVIMGNNGDPLKIQFTELETSTDFNARVGREWKVSKTANFGQSVNLKFSGYDDEWYLISSATGNFSSGVSIVGSLDNSGAINATLTDGTFYTLASFVKSPGGVFEDLNLWLKADTGTSSNLLQDSDLAFNDGSWTVTGNLSTSDGRFYFNSGNTTPNGVVTQSFNTVLNESYELNYRAGQIHSGAQTYRGPVSLRIDIIDNVTSNILATETVTKMGYTGVTYHNLDFSASSTDTRIEITDTTGSTTNIDIWADEFIVSSKIDVNIGESVDIWEDQSVGGNDGYQFQAATSKLAVLSAANLNFNPSLTFDGTNDFYKLPTGIIDAGNTNYSIISVQTQDVKEEGQVLFLGKSSVNDGIHHQLDATGKFESSWPNNAFHAGAPIPNVSDIYTATYNNTSGKVMRQDGLEVGTNTSTALTFIENNTNHIGRFLTTNYFDGNINEIIVYNNETTTGVELQRIESYLAIKYGITLDQAVATNYLASDATVLWNATTNSSFSNDIAGIGRDELSALTQKQSKSVNDDAMVTIGLGTIAATNVANTNTFTTDKDFLVWGNDNASTSVVNSGIPSVFSEKINRNWLVNETGAVGTTLIQIPNTAVAGFTNTASLMLFVADDAGFTTNLIGIPLVQNGANWEALYDFNGVKYFTFGIVASGDFMRHGKSFQNGVEKSMKF